MNIGTWFWILMAFWLFFGLYWNRPAGPFNWRVTGGDLVLFVLLVFLGWHAFGPPIHV